LNDIVDNSSHLLVLDGGNKLLAALNDTHDLPAEVAIAGDAAVVDALILIKIICQFL
jgi:hypothetical protein